MFIIWILVKICLHLPSTPEETISVNIFKPFDAASVKSVPAVLDAMIDDEKVLKDYIVKRHEQNDKDTVFDEYLTRLEMQIERLDDIANFNNMYWREEEKAQKEGKVQGGDITFKITIKKEKDEWDEETIIITSVNIENYDLPMMRYGALDDNEYIPELDYKYLNKSYSKYLSRAYKDYLAIKEREQKDLGRVANWIHETSLPISKRNMAEWTLLWQEFNKKYPNFSRHKATTSYVNRYLDMLILDEYQTFDDWNTKMFPDCIKAYEYYLAHADKSSYEYKKLKTFYDLLKSKDFIVDSDFNDLLLKYAHEEAQ